MANRQTVIDLLQACVPTAVITGAGVSSESGVPTFRGAGGLWRSYRAEDLATPAAFARDPRLVWEWYDMRRKICAEAAPNPAHLTIADMERRLPQFLLITQNVDGLHGRAGNRGHVEIHGNIFRARCTRACSSPRARDLPYVPSMQLPPTCPDCGAMLRPDIVWFGESYDPALLDRCTAFLENARLVIVAGTSGVVPIPIHLASLAAARGALVVDVNPEYSGVRDIADAVIQGKAGEALPELWGAAFGGDQARKRRSPGPAGPSRAAEPGDGPGTDSN